jgi:hypothetical protein
LARSKKNTEIQNIDENAPLTEEQLQYVINFAKVLTNSGFPNMSFNPMLVNQRMQDITLNPLLATSDGVEKALANPKENERKLIGYSENLEISDMLYRRLILYLSGMLSFNLDWVCINAETEKDFSSPAYKKDYGEVIGFLDKFDVKAEFKKVLREMVRREAYFGQLRTEFKDKYTLQELPEDRCLITGRFPFGLLFDFDMSFFLNSSVSIDMFSPIFKKFYLELFNNGTKDYDPAKQWNDRDGSYVYYVQTSPADGFVCFKLFEELASRIPILAPMFPDILLKPIMRKLSTNASIQAATKIVLGQVPLLKGDTKGASVKDSFAISAENLARFLQLLRTGISQEISLGAAPLENISSFEYKMPDRNILGEYTQVAASTSGVNSRLIYGYDKQNLEETRNSIAVDEYMMTPVYSVFENWLNYQINLKTKKYKWKFLLSGTEFDTAKRKKLEDAITLSDKGFFIPGMFASSIGVQKQDLERMLLETKANKWDEKLTMVMSAFQMSGKEGENGAGGRPKKKDSELSDSGEQTRSDGENLGRGGKL